MKKFLVFMVTLLMIFSSLTVAVADGKPGDEYYQQAEGWPNRHWVYMTDAEIAQYEAAGWERYVGVLWYHGDEPDPTEGPEAVFEINLTQIDQMYTDGDHFDVIYHWICPATKLNKYQEQSVYVGRWVLSQEQVLQYYENYQVPEIPALEEPKDCRFTSQWYLDGKAADWKEDATEDELNEFVCVREVFDHYDFEYGSNLFLKNGDRAEYSYSQAVDIKFENEIY